jgi:DNA-binding response OmpR family regulator
MERPTPVILCIDDDSDILEFLRTVLEAEGLTYVGAASAEEALKRFRATPPDLIIVDMMMEEVDSGAGLVRELQRLGNEAPIYMLSSVGDSLSMTTDTADLGLAGVFQKPLSSALLISAVRTRLGVVDQATD